MKFFADSGLWTTGPPIAPEPLTAVIELAGAILSWTVDGPPSDAWVRLTVTDIDRADWLWRLVGEDGHAAIVAALASDTVPAGEREVPAVGFAAGALATLQRLAFGHWLRRWWPASDRDGIAALDGALLDGELALLTAAAQDYFGDGTLDSEVPSLLRPHAATLAALAQAGDQRVSRLVASCAELAADYGVDFRGGAAPTAVRRRDDYALAAGPGGAEPQGTAIATGVRSLPWAPVPPGVFDAAEETVDWRIETDDSAVSAVVGARLSGNGSPAGITVTVRSGQLHGAGEFTDAGRASVQLLDRANAPVTESTAWNHDWNNIEVIVGVRVSEPVDVRNRVRAVARSRLRGPGADAFVAEVLAAESDY